MDFYTYEKDRYEPVFEEVSNLIPTFEEERGFFQSNLQQERTLQKILRDWIVFTLLWSCLCIGVYIYLTQPEFNSELANTPAVENLLENSSSSVYRSIQAV